MRRACTAWACWHTRGKYQLKTFMGQVWIGLLQDAATSTRTAVPTVSATATATSASAGDATAHDGAETGDAAVLRRGAATACCSSAAGRRRVFATREPAADVFHAYASSSRNATSGASTIGRSNGCSTGTSSSPATAIQLPKPSAAARWPIACFSHVPASQ